MDASVRTNIFRWPQVIAKMSVISRRQSTDHLRCMACRHSFDYLRSKEDFLAITCVHCTDVMWRCAFTGLLTHKSMRATCKFLYNVHQFGQRKEWHSSLLKFKYKLSNFMQNKYTYLAWMYNIAKGNNDCSTKSAYTVDCKKKNALKVVWHICKTSWGVLKRRSL